MGVGQGLSQEEDLLKTLMSGGKDRGFWRKSSDLLPPPSVREGRGMGVMREAHGMGPRHIGQRTTVEKDRKMTGAGRGDTV